MVVQFLFHFYRHPIRMLCVCVCAFVRGRAFSFVTITVLGKARKYREECNNQYITAVHETTVVVSYASCLV